MFTQPFFLAIRLVFVTFILAIYFMPFDLKNAIHAYQKGNIDAFEGIYQAISAKMFAVCLRYAGNRKEAGRWLVGTQTTGRNRNEYKSKKSSYSNDFFIDIIFRFVLKRIFFLFSHFGLMP